VSAYLPAILGTLTVVPVYFIGKILINRWAGVLSAALIAILPGEFLGRTLLGYTDRDAFEVMLSALTILLLILTIKSAREKHLSFRSLYWRNLTFYARPLLYALILGIVIGLYVLTWRGSFIFILIILVYFVIQSIIDQFKRRSAEYLGLVSIIAFLTALVLFLIGSRLPLVTAALILSVLTVVVLTVLASIMARQKANPVFYPLSIIMIVLLGLGIFYAANPELFHAMLNQFRAFLPTGTNSSITEMQPILFPSGTFSLAVAWSNFTTGIILVFVSLGILISVITKRDEPDKVLFLVWSVIQLIATILTRRMALLFALNVALLMGYLGWLIMEFMIKKTRNRILAQAPVIETLKKKKKHENTPKKISNSFLVRNRIAVLTLTAIALFFLFLFPDLGPAIEASSQAPVNVPSNDWYQALNWLRENTPEPFEDADAYYQYYSHTVPYPSSAYGIVAWWDYGYWIMRIGHRLPVSDPGGGARKQVAKLFTSQNETAANKIVDQLRTQYLIIDDSTIYNKMGGVTTYAGLDLSQFGEVYYSSNAGKLSPVNYYYPIYFQSLAVRLFRFDGGPVTPQSTRVISYQDKVTSEGSPYKEIVSTNNFSTYKEAVDFIGQQKTGNYKIVSNSRSESPVPLESLQHYKKVYPANPKDSTTVKIFEYLK
jgi:dolichyl-phosphooligosaccharide-protein glycotransferase